MYVAERAEPYPAASGRRSTILQYDSVAPPSSANKSKFSAGPVSDRKTSFNCTAFALVALLFQAFPVAAEYRIQPALSFSEEYNDNIFLTPSSQVEDYITRVVPSMNFKYSTALWDWDVAYAYDYRYYARRTVINDSTHTINLMNHTTVIKDTFFIDVRDNYSRVSLNVIQDYTQQSPFFNQTDNNVLTVDPYFVLPLSSRMTVTTGYQYRNVWYKEPVAVNKTDQSAYADAHEELSLRTSLTAGVRHTYTYTETEISSLHKTDLYAGPRHEFADGSLFWLIIGNSWLDSQQLGKGSQAFWDTGLKLKYVTYSLVFNAALTYIDDPSFAPDGTPRVLRREDRYTGTFKKETDRFALSFSAERWEYRDVLTKHLQNTRYTTGGSISHAFTPTIRGTYTLNIDRYEDNQLNTFSMLYLDGVKLEYLPATDTTIAVYYRFTHSYSPDPVNFNLNYDNNRIAVEFSRKF